MRSWNVQNIVTLTLLTALIVCELFIDSVWVTISLAVLTVAACFWSKQALKQSIRKSLGIKSKHGLKESVLQMLNTMQAGMKEASQLVTELGKDGHREFNELSEDHELAQAINKADEQIKSFNENEAKRKWRVEGLAKFSELLRSHDANIEDLSNNLISGLVKYVDANQGGIFLSKKEEEEEYLELTGCYAYDKARIRSKKVAIGQGLLGQCYLERDTLFILDIPSEYVNITSGLGEATPRNLVLVPLIVNESIYGVMEFATFIPLEEHQIAFLEQVAENIASVFASLMTADKTKKLLDDSQKLTVELQSREEEMRQNMEELTATQEEMNRKQAELDGIVGGINNTLGLAELDREGRITFANHLFNEILEHTEESILSIDYRDIIGKRDSTREFIDRIANHQLSTSDYQTTTRHGKKVWLSLSFSPMLDAQGHTNKILVLGRDITERKLEEIEFEKLSLVADNTDNSVIITDKEGVIEYVNHGFCDMTGYNEQEVIGRRPGEFLQGEETDLETVARIREGLKKKVPIYEEILNYTKSGETYWISMAINPVFNEKDELDKYISIQANITETKKNALDLSYKLTAISKSNAIIEFDTSGDILDANDNYLKIFGYSKEEVVGKHHRIFVKPTEANAESYKAFWEQLKEGKFVSDEFEGVRKDGKAVWLKGIFNPIYDINGQPYKIVKFAVDITQEKLLKLETQKQQAELNSQLEAINKTIASVTFDMDGNLKDANDIFLSITGIPHEKIAGLHYLDIIPIADHGKPQTELMWNNLKEGKFFSGEFKFKDQSDKELWLKGTFNPILDVNGQPYKVMMYAQFNTAEKEKQKTLTGTVNALKNTTPTIELNADGTFKNGNELFFKKFGYKRLELRKKPFNEFLSSTKGVSFEKLLPDLTKAGFAEHTLDFTDANGISKTYHTSFSTINDLEEQLSKIVVIMIDRDLVLKF